MALMDIYTSERVIPASSVVSGVHSRKVKAIVAEGTKEKINAES